MEQLYYLSYKGKKLGDKMTLDSAEGMMLQMSSCFKDLSLMQAAASANTKEQPALQASDRKRRKKATGGYSNMA